MLNTSQQYKDFVYSTDYARHFSTEVLIKVLDADASKPRAYNTTNSSWVTDLTQLTNEVMSITNKAGTFELDFFKLDGSMSPFYNYQATGLGEVGYMSEAISNSEGGFTLPIEITCVHETRISSAGRTLIFEDDSAPKDLDLIYTRQGVEVGRHEIRNNTVSEVVSTEGVDNYDTFKLVIYSTIKPHRRIRLIEDIPGVYKVYSDTEIISINDIDTVDIFSKEIITSETDIVISNEDKMLDILNPTGFEKYLQRKQEVEISYNMVYPDGTQERLSSGTRYLYNWKAAKGTLSANFIVRDALDNLNSGEYVKGKLPGAAVTMYSLAEDILLEAGIQDYIIDTQLLNIYTTGIIPISSYKEALRLVAQASQSVVIKDALGRIHVKYISPLVTAYNLITNSDFSDGLTGWTQSGCTLNSSNLYTGIQSVAMNASSYISKNVTIPANNKMYFRVYVFIPAGGISSPLNITFNNTNIVADLSTVPTEAGAWNLISGTVYAATATTAAFKVSNQNAGVYVDAFMALNISQIYGLGSEPAQQWCDTYIRYFRNSLTIPPYTLPLPVDTLDYWILLDSPGISLNTPVSKVTANIYSNTKATATSEAYNGTRVIRGIETFVVKYNGSYADCVATITNGTLVSAEYFANAARLTIQAVNSNAATIVINGKKITTDSSEFSIDNEVDKNLIQDAKEEVIDNKLITIYENAEQVTNYAAYWYNRRYKYEFDWRQNPAIQLLDNVIVCDDFNRNNEVLITDNVTSYVGGTLSGSSKGIY